MRISSILVLVLAFGCGPDDRRAIGDGGPSVDAGPPSDGGSSDAGPFFDAGRPGDGGGADAASSVDAGGRDAGPPSMAAIELSFGGCSPDFTGDVVVARNASSVAVSSTSSGSLTGSVQVSLDGLIGPQAISTQHRVDTGAVINVVVGTTWTNIAQDSSGVLSGGVPDPIGGTLRIDAYDRAAAVMDLTFSDVSLQNPSDGTICMVNGRLQTFGPTF